MRTLSIALLAMGFATVLGALSCKSGGRSSTATDTTRYNATTVRILKAPCDTILTDTTHCAKPKATTLKVPCDTIATDTTHCVNPKATILKARRDSTGTDTTRKLD